MKERIKFTNKYFYIVEDVSRIEGMNILRSRDLRFPKRVQSAFFMVQNNKDVKLRATKLISKNNKNIR